MTNITEDTPKSKPASAVLDVEGRTVRLTGRCAELAAKLAAEGSATAADFPAGTRVSSYVHRCRWRHGLPIVAQTEAAPAGEARFARYRFAAPVELVEFTPRQRA